MNVPREGIFIMILKFYYTELTALSSLSGILIPNVLQKFNFGNNTWNQTAQLSQDSIESNEHVL